MQINRLDFAHILCKNSILSKGGNESTSTLIGCFAYLLQRGNECILIDCGIEDIDVVNQTKTSQDDWARDECEGTVAENLVRCKVLPEQISKVFLTHSHYDHMSGIMNFKNAVIYMSKKEYEYMHSEGNSHKPFLLEQISFLDEKKAAGKLILTEEIYEEEGVRCQVVGGHTPGSMLVTIEEYMFTGDAVFLLKNVVSETPIGFCANPEEARRAVSICKAHKGVVLTGHDFTCPKVMGG